jgi:hypothetical protein
VLSFGPVSLCPWGGKENPIVSHPWYLADIPMGSTDALAAVVSSPYTEDPIASQVVGYCFSDHSVCWDPTMRSCNNTGKAEYEVVLYDPRCVCNTRLEETLDGFIELPQPWW